MTEILYDNATGKRSLPAELITKIIEQSVLDSTLQSSLELRHVCKWFDTELVRLMFVVQITPNFAETVHKARLPENLSIAMLQGFMTARVLTEKLDRRVRRRILQYLHISPEELPDKPCLHYRGPTAGCALLEGSSKSNETTSICTTHKLYSTLVAAFGSNIVHLGNTVFNTIGRTNFPGCVYFLTLLMNCFDCNDTKVIEIFGEMEKVMAESQPQFLGHIYVTCFWLTVRRLNLIQSNPKTIGSHKNGSANILDAAEVDHYLRMLSTLHGEVTSRESLLTALHQNYPDNILVEAARTGQIPVFEMLMKRRWKFTGGSWPYIRILKLIMYCKLYVPESQELEIRKALMSTLFEWTDEWRNIEETKTYLMKAGSKHLQWPIEIMVESLKNAHFFRHERGNEGDFLLGEPLQSVAEGSVEMVKLFMDNRKILLPHTLEAQDSDMRYHAICNEFNRETVQEDMIKTILIYSQDLIEEKTRLQKLLKNQYSKPIRTWAFIAEQVGLDLPASDESDAETTGSEMLGKAVSVLNVETVRYLLAKRVRLMKSASAPQVYSDDDENLNKLITINKLLRNYGQGGTQERRIIEMTFLTTSFPVSSTSMETKKTLQNSVEMSEDFLKQNIVAARSSLKRHRKSRWPSKIG